MGVRDEQEPLAGEPVTEEQEIDQESLDAARGYRVGSWGGRPNYTEVDGPYATLDEEAMKRHVAAKRRLNRSE